MNRTLNRLITALIISLTLSLSVAADEEYLDVDSFDGIDIGTGMWATVICGSSNSVIIEGDKKDLDNIKVTVRGSVLDISRQNSASRILNNIFGKDKHHSRINVEITTSGQLSKIEASTGANVAVPACAVNNSFVEIDTSTGSIINIEGSTASLELDLSTGSLFNKKARSFVVDTADIDLSTGAIANLCGASVIRGDVSTGAIISASDSADVDVDLSTGAQVSKKKCR